MTLTIDLAGSVDRLTDSIQVQVPGVLYNVVRMAVWDAIEDFCARSGYWRETVSWSLTNSVSSVQLTTGAADKLIQQIVEVYGLAQYRVQQPDTLIIVGSNVTATGTALVTLRPASLDDTPSFIINSWFEVLRDGALSRLFIEPFKPYTNTELGSAFAGLFEQGILRAREQAPQVVGAEAFAEAPDALDRLYQNVSAELDAPHTQVQLAAWNTIEDFYIRSTWRREMLYWQMQGNVAQVDFNPFDGDWLVAWILNFSGLTRGKVELPGLLKDLTSPTPTTLRNGQVLVALKPATLTSEFDASLWQQWFDTILSGTLHRLYRQPNKTYSNPQMALFHGKEFASGLARARAIASKSYTNTVSPTFPYFARGRAR